MRGLARYDRKHDNLYWTKFSVPLGFQFPVVGFKKFNRLGFGSGRVWVLIGFGSKNVFPDISIVHRKKKKLVILTLIIPLLCFTRIFLARKLCINKLPHHMPNVQCVSNKYVLQLQNYLPFGYFLGMKK